MDLNEISVFVKVVQAGSFNGAALALGMPKSTVSAKVSSLEKRLGTTLLHRTTRKLNVTQAGQEFFQRCLAAVEMLKEAEERASQGQDRPRGHLKVTAAPAWAGALSDVAAEFRSKYPDVELEFVLTDRTVDLVGESIDLAIRAGDLKDSTLIARKIGQSAFAPFASPAYLKSAPKLAHPKDLAALDCIQYAPLGRHQWTLVNKTGMKVSVALSGKFLTDDLGIARQLALSGQGVALMPMFLCKDEHEKKKLARVLPEWRSEIHPVSFVYPRQSFVPLRTSVFIETALPILKERLA